MFKILKKYFKNRIFLFLVINTASACILFMVFNKAQKIKKITRTFSCIVDKPITAEEANEFLKTLNLQNDNEIEYLNSEMRSYEQRISFQIKYITENADDLIDEFNNRWAEHFRSRSINLYSLEKKTLPRAIYDDTKRVIIVSDSNEFKGKVPEFLSLQSYSTTSEKITIYNFAPYDNSSLIEVQDQTRIMVLGKKHNLSYYNGKALIAIKTNNGTTFFEMEKLIIH